MPPILPVLLLAVLASPAVRANQLNLQTPVTSVARDVYDLHTLLLYITIAIVVAVFGVMFYAIVRHRKSAGHQAKQFHENTTVASGSGSTTTWTTAWRS